MSLALAEPSALRSGRWTDRDDNAASGPGFIALLEAFRATGGTAPSEILGRLLEEPRAGEPVSLAELIDTSQVFGFRWRSSLWIPMFQFDADDLGLRAGAQELRAELPALWSGWTLATWFAAANPGLGGCRPVDRLQAEPDAVLQLARAMHATDDFALALPPQLHHSRETTARL